MTPPQDALPLVSVIVPSYNHARYIGCTLESMAQQTYGHVEVIVIDDASKDESPDIIRRFSERDGFRTICKTINHGLVATLNQGLELARGQYVTLCASDDFWAPDKIAAQVAEFESDSAIRIAFTEGWEIDEQGQVLGEVHYTKRDLKKWFYDDVLLKADLPPASFMARRLEMVKVGGYDERFKIEDFAMWLQLLRGGGYAIVVREKLAYYRNHSQNMHNVQSDMVLDAHFAIVQHFSENRSDQRKYLDEWRLRNANYLAATDKRKSIAYLLPAWSNVLDYRLYASIYKYLTKW